MYNFSFIRHAKARRLQLPEQALSADRNVAFGRAGCQIDGGVIRAKLVPNIVLQIYRAGEVQHLLIS